MQNRPAHWQRGGFARIPSFFLPDQEIIVPGTAVDSSDNDFVPGIRKTRFYNR